MTQQQMNGSVRPMNSFRPGVQPGQGPSERDGARTECAGVHKHAFRLLPESSVRRGLSLFAEYLSTAVKKPTPPVINAQCRSFHRVSPRGSSSCYVNFPDSANLSNSAVLSLFDAIPCDPPLSRVFGRGIFLR
jgi:hypothetical protein